MFSTLLKIKELLGALNTDLKSYSGMPGKDESLFLEVKLLVQSESRDFSHGSLWSELLLEGSGRTDLMLHVSLLLY